MAESPRMRPPVRGDSVLRRRRMVALATTAALVAGGIGIAIATKGDDGAAPANVRLDGVDLSGMSPEQVRAAARTHAAALMKMPVVITRTDDPSVRIEVSRASLGARPQIRRAVSEALAPRSFGGRLISTVGLSRARNVRLGFTLDPRKVSALVARVRGSQDLAPRPAGIVIGPTDITVVPGRAGRGIDPRGLRETISRLPERIDLTPAQIPPPVSDATAEGARLRALALISQPVSVTLQGRGVTLEPSVLRAALRATPRPPEIALTLDPDTLYEDISSAFSTREEPARDARFVIAGSSVRLIPSRIGRSLDMPAIARAIVEAPGTREVRARFRIDRPTRTTESARSLKITELISEYQTPYNCCEPRVTNIQRAAEILDGMIIPAGGRFSLNEALGQRTLEAGFVSAPQIAGGRLEDAVGGGVSQVATTIYNAAFFGGLELVAHTPHQFWISRYPKGREATLSYGGPELVFVNDWPAAILISVTAGSNAVTVRFFSSRLGRRVETETAEPTDFVEPTTREIPDPTLDRGERVVEQELGGSGFSVTYTRRVYEGDRRRRDERYSWTYDAQDAFVKVGPPKRPAPKRPAPDPDDPGGPGTTTPDTPAPPSPPATTTPTVAAPP